MWLGFCAVEVELSPKFHDHDVGVSVDWSVKDTSSGAVPVSGVPENAAVGAFPGLLTEM